MQRSALPGRFDRDRFRRLIELVGPGMVPVLLAQLAADLGNCDSRLSQGTATGDWALLRETSHDLVALAGSCGALALQDLAQDLNAAAHARDPATTRRLVPAIAAELAALLALIRATPPEGPLPW